MYVFSSMIFRQFYFVNGGFCEKDADCAEGPKSTPETERMQGDEVCGAGAILRGNACERSVPSVGKLLGRIGTTFPLLM